MFLQKRRDGKVSQYLTALQCRYFGHIPSADITIKLSSSRKCCTILTRRMIKSWWWNKKIGECFFVRILFTIDSKLIVTNNEDKKTIHCDRLTVSHSGDGPRVPFWNVRVSRLHVIKKISHVRYLRCVPILNVTIRTTTLSYAVPLLYK